MLFKKSQYDVMKQRFLVDGEFDVRGLILELESISHIPDVSVNGQKVKKKGDSYLSFLVDLTTALNYGQENEILLEDECQLCVPCGPTGTPLFS